MNNFSVIFLISILVFISCNKDDDSVVGDSEFATATVNNAPFVASQDTEEIRFMRARIRTGNVLDVLAREDGTNNDFKNVIFYLSNYQGAGTYKTGLSEDEPHHIEYSIGSGSYQRYSNSIFQKDIPGFEPGTVVINSDDGNIIKGTFNFVGYNSGDQTVTVTNGKFQINYEN